MGNKLKKEITDLTDRHDKAESEYKLLKNSLEKISKEITRTDTAIVKVGRDTAKESTLIQELTLMNEMAQKELEIVTVDKEDVMVQNDVMKLEFIKLKEKLDVDIDKVYGLENRMEQL